MRKFVFIIAFLCCKVSFGQDSTRLSLLFLGDIMQHDSQIADAWDPKTGTYNYDECLQHVKPYAEGVDLTIGNLEVTIAGKPYKGYPQFSAPDELLHGLKKMGTDILVTANNHCVDRGKKGLERTITMLDSLDIPHTGTFRNEAEKKKLHPLLVEKGNFKLALLNYTYGTNGLPVSPPNIVNMINTDQMIKDLQVARSMKVDAIIVFIHWGSEYQSLPAPWQKELGNTLFKHGADIVIGAHPHVIQPMEWRKDKNQFIAYSLGNFVSGQRKRYTDGGAMVRMELAKAKGGTGAVIKKAEYILQWVHRDAAKNYVVWPAPMLEEKALYKNLGPTSMEAFTTFVKDSRDLLGKHNVGVSELKALPSDKEIKSTGDTLGVNIILRDAGKIDQLYSTPTQKKTVGNLNVPVSPQPVLKIDSLKKEND